MPRQSNERALIKIVTAELSRLSPHERVLVACSGGRDSMALLQASVAVLSSARVAVAHFDHQLRATSHEDAAFVRRRAEQLGVPFFEGTAETKPTSNIESWARMARYEFLERARRESGCDWIATAHHTRDQAETLLLRLFSGRALTSFMSIAERDLSRRLIRPLLSVGADEIAAYAQAGNLSFIEDQTNRDPRFDRNYLRLKIFPHLRRRFGSLLDQRVMRAAQLLNEDEAFIRKEALRVIDTAPCRDVAVLTKLEPALRRRVLQLLFQRDTDSEHLLGFAAQHRLVQAFSRYGAKTVELGHGFRAQIEFGQLRFEPISGTEKAYRSVLDLPGVLRQSAARGEFEISAKIVAADSESIARIVRLGKGGGTLQQAEAVFDLRDLPSSFLIRSRNDGDRMRVALRGERSVKKLFQESRVALTLRSSIPIVECEGDILWIPGVARSEKALVSRDSPPSKILVLSYMANWL